MPSTRWRRSTPLTSFALHKEADDPLGCDDIAAMAAGSPLFSSRAEQEEEEEEVVEVLAVMGPGRSSSSTRLAWATTWRELPVIVHALSRPGGGGGGDDDDGGESTGYTTGQNLTAGAWGSSREGSGGDDDEQPGLMERTRREAAILRALRVRGVTACTLSDRAAPPTSRSLHLSLWNNCCFRTYQLRGGCGGG